MLLFFILVSSLVNAEDIIRINGEDLIQFGENPDDMVLVEVWDNGDNSTMSKGMLPWFRYRLTSKVSFN